MDFWSLKIIFYIARYAPWKKSVRVCRWLESASIPPHRPPLFSTESRDYTFRHSGATVSVNHDEKGGRSSVLARQPYRSDLPVERRVIFLFFILAFLLAFFLSFTLSVDRERLGNRTFPLKLIYFRSTRRPKTGRKEEPDSPLRSKKYATARKSAQRPADPPAESFLNDFLPSFSFLF